MNPLFTLLLTLLSLIPPAPTISMYKKTFPELQAYVNWQQVPGASYYKIYEYGQFGSTCPTADSSYTFDTSVTKSWYLDDPNPGWWKVNIIDRGNWQRRWWCYEITSVVNGVESARSEPVIVAIGASGYITMQYQTACQNGQLIPFPYTLSQMEIHIYYRDSNNVDHEFDYITNFGPNFFEIEFKIPEIAKDGTVIPLVEKTGYNGYWYSWKTPDMSQPKEDNFMPEYQPDSVSYSQINIRKVQYGEYCVMPWERDGSNYAWHQNVTR